MTSYKIESRSAANARGVMYEVQKDGETLGTFSSERCAREWVAKESDRGRVWEDALQLLEQAHAAEAQGDLARRNDALRQARELYREAGRPGLEAYCSRWIGRKFDGALGA